MKCEICELGELRDYIFVVVISRYRGQWLLSRKKGASTWETQGGHIERGESPLDAAKRELYEESGAAEFTITPVCDYWAGSGDGTRRANGQVFFAEITKLGCLPESEMEETASFDALPAALSYPDITPKLFAVLESRLNREQEKTAGC